MAPVIIRGTPSHPRPCTGSAPLCSHFRSYALPGSHALPSQTAQAVSVPRQWEGAWLSLPSHPAPHPHPAPTLLTFQPLLSVAVRLAVLVCHWTRRTRKEGRAHVNSSATDPRLPGQLRQHASRILLDLMCYQTNLTLGKVAPLSDYSRRLKPSTAAGPGRPLPESGDTQVQLSQSLHH